MRAADQTQPGKIEPAVRGQQAPGDWLCRRQMPPESLGEAAQRLLLAASCRTRISCVPG